MLSIRRLAREFGWAPAEILSAPAQLIRDLLAANELGGQMRR